MERHPIDAVSLVAGVAFTALGALYLFGGRLPSIAVGRWLGPLLVVGIGLVLILSASRTDRRSDGPET